MKISGTIESLNVSPKGFYEGLLLRSDDGVMQVNFPKDARDGAVSQLQEGGELTAEVEATEPWGEPDHDVYSLVRIVSVNGKPAAQESGTNGHFAGRVVRLNYALHGEVNGGILDSGDFLHLKPEGARAVGLEAGMDVAGHGSRKPMVGNRWVIEAEEVNGTPIREGGAKKHAAKKHAAKKHAKKKH